MKLKVNYLFFCCLSLILATNNICAQDNKTDYITFIQGDSTFKIINNSDSIILEKNKFSLRYFGNKYDEDNKKFYSAQVAVLDTYKDTLLIKIGQKLEMIPYFEPGSGMSPGENGKYDQMYITNSGHHYLMYKDENDKRVDVISSNKDKFQFEWKISEVNYNEKDYLLTDLQISELYFVVFVNSNLNDIVDRDEVKIIKLKFR